MNTTKAKQNTPVKKTTRKTTQKPATAKAKASKPPRKKPTVLITGAAGALAQQVINRLRKTYKIVAVDFREQMSLSEDIDCYKLDFNKRVFEDLFKTYHFDSVIHLGRIQSSEDTRLNRYNANVLGSQKLMDLSHKYGIRHLIVLSTYHVYGADAYNPALIDEKAPLKAAELTQDLIDSVELENLANVYLWKYPDLNITILRPCNIVGPGVKNTISRLLSSKYPPSLWGFSPMMQFIHIDDMADAIELAHKKFHRGVYNVAPNDWVAYQEALELSGCKSFPVPSIPPVLPRLIARILGLQSFPAYLVNYFKYPVIIDGREFEKAFGFKAKRSLKEILQSYRDLKNI
jgi:UDP-glucose 4-epimerase